MSVRNSLRANLEDSITANVGNNFGRDNFDENRFGKYVAPGFIGELKRVVKRLTSYDLRLARQSTDRLFQKYGAQLERIYENLVEGDRNLLLALIAFRVLGYRKVKLPSNNSKYIEALSQASPLANQEDSYDPHFMGFILKKFDLNPIGHDVQFYFNEQGVAIDFIIEQYAYKKADVNISVETGDVVLDLGGCWGDTALYFASKAGPRGKVYSFEFIPDNIKLFEINKDFNKHFSDRIELVRHPVSNIAGQEIFFKDNGPGSRIEFVPFKGYTGSTTTVSIDSFVSMKGIERVDFIKMDIEGAEPSALAGGLETIRKHKPKLAIAIYHSMGDFVRIPNWILDLDLGYRIFLDHFTIHAEETVCFASCEK
jgi:FkbM family methyltransferase